jgi:hypothetical protein
MRLVVTLESDTYNFEHYEIIKSATEVREFLGIPEGMTINGARVNYSQPGEEIVFMAVKWVRKGE